MIADETDLVRRVLDGDREAYEEIVRTHQGSIFAFLRSLLGDHHLTQDLTQETFFRAYASLSRFDPSKSLRNWLLGISYHLWVDWVRKRKEVLFREVTEDEMLEERGLFMQRGRQRGEREDLAAKDEERELMGRVVAALPEDYQSVLSLRYVEGMKRRDIARLLGISEFNVKMRLYRGKKELARAWKRLAT